MALAIAAPVESVALRRLAYVRVAEQRGRFAVHQYLDTSADGMGDIDAEACVRALAQRQRTAHRHLSPSVLRVEVEPTVATPLHVDEHPTAANAGQDRRLGQIVRMHHRRGYADAACTERSVLQRRIVVVAAADGGQPIPGG